MSIFLLTALINYTLFFIVKQEVVRQVISLTKVKAKASKAAFLEHSTFIDKVHGVKFYVTDGDALDQYSGACSIACLNSIFVSRATVDALSEDELYAILMHEVGHVKNDSMLNFFGLMSITFRELRADWYSIQHGSEPVMYLKTLKKLYFYRKSNLLITILNLPQFLWIHLPRLVFITAAIIVKR
jgi:hypothetical protein